MTSPCLSQFRGWKILILVGVRRGHSGISWRVNGVLFVGVSYRESCGFFYCSTFSQPFPVFIACSCSWRDCTLGEVLIYSGKIIMINYFILWFKSYVFVFQNTLRSKFQNISCKNVKQWRNSAISPLSCCELL